MAAVLLIGVVACAVATDRLADNSHCWFHSLQAANFELLAALAAVVGGAVVDYGVVVVVETR